MREEYAQQGEGLTLRLDALPNRMPLKSKANERLRLGILKQDMLDRLWQFLKDPDILPMNNAAERSLRTVVMARKVSQCSKNVVETQNVHAPQVHGGNGAVTGSGSRHGSDQPHPLTLITDTLFTSKYQLLSPSLSLQSWH